MAGQLTSNSLPSAYFTEENFTSEPSEPPNEELHPYGVLVFVACVWILVAVLGITGNIIVILSVVLSKSVRTMTNVLVVNLSVADLWTSLSLPWTSVALLSNGTLPLTSVVPCQVTEFMWHTGLGASLYNLALISVNRLVRITRPAIYRQLFTPCKMACIVAVSWFIPFFVILFPTFIGVDSLGHDLKHNSCSDDDNHPRAADYNLAQTIGFYPIPMTTVIISYVLIYIYIRRHFKQQKGNKGASDPIEASGAGMASMSISDSEATADDKHKRKVSQQQLQITKNLFMTVCAFTVCISPYFISLFVPTSEIFTLYGATILIFNSCVNPLIYAAKHPQFKKVLRPMMRCRWSEIPEPSRVLLAVRANVDTIVSLTPS